MSPGCLAGKRTDKWVALVNRGSSPPFCAIHQTISVFFHIDVLRLVHSVGQANGTAPILNDKCNIPQPELVDQGVQVPGVIYRMV